MRNKENIIQYSLRKAHKSLIFDDLQYNIQFV